MLDLASGLDRDRFLPVVVSNSPIVNRAAMELGITVESASGWDESGQQLLPSRARVREMRELLERYDVGLVHVNNLLPLKSVLPAARERCVPVVAHMHMRTNTHERLYTALHQATVIVGCGESVLEGAREDGIAASRIRVIYNGIDEQSLLAGSAQDLRSSLGIADDDIVATSVASLIERKGIDTLIRAIALLDHEKPAVHLLLVGAGPQTEEYEQLVLDLGVEKRVHFLGERDDVGAILRDATDVAVTASRSEAFPLNVLEAGLCGRPIIASDIPAHREGIIDCVTGLFVPVDNELEFAAALRRLGSSAAERESLGQSAASFIRERFLLRHYVTAFEALYVELTSTDRRRYGWLRGWNWPPVYNTWLRLAVTRRIGLHGGRNNP